MATGTAAAGKKRQVTDAHKEAMAAGREQGRAVARYLEVLGDRPKRGRKRNPQSITKRLTVIEGALSNGANPLQRLKLVQERLDLQDELAKLQTTVSESDRAAAEAAFVNVAAGYSERKGLSRAAWREIGVPPAVLSKAGIR